MNSLINIENQEGQAVVSSREVAVNFEKEHKNVLRDIRSLIELAKNSQSSKLSHHFVESKFFESKYESSGCFYKEYLMNRDGFTLLAMGFTGQKALEWKLKYIEAFNRMEEALKQEKYPQLSAMEMMELQFQIIKETKSEVKEWTGRIEHLENNMVIEHSQANTIQKLVKKRVLDIMGNGYYNKSLKSRVFSSVWKHYKDFFDITSYHDTLKKDFDRAIEIIQSWNPSGSLLREISEENMQVRI